MRKDITKKVVEALAAEGITEEQLIGILDYVRNTQNFGEPFEIMMRVETNGVRFEEFSENQ